jgi:S1-C subfamily serine protease
MYKFLPLIIGTCLLIAGCNSTPNYRQVSITEIPDYNDAISNIKPGVYSSAWVQPKNKSENCEILFEDYQDFSTDNDYEWDGNCENGKAEGLGKVSIAYGSVYSYEITYLNEGISDQHYYSWTEGTGVVNFGRYVHANNKMVKRFDNGATLKPNGDIDSALRKLEIDLVKGTLKGTGYKYYSDGIVEYTGLSGNLLFFGSRKFFDKNNKPINTFWGFWDAEADKPHKYVLFKNNVNGSLWHQKYGYGNVKELVQLPQTYINNAMKVSNDALKSAKQAVMAGNLALAMKKRYDTLHISTSSAGAPEKPTPEPSRGISTGTGFFISNDGYILTNSHVIEGSKNISIILNGKSVSATLVDHDGSNDIALLKVNKTVKGLPIELKKKIKQGTDITVLGYPNIGLQGNEQKATFGYINANSGIQGDTRYYQISSPIQPGNSGSPLVNEKGIVIGIASASLNQSAAIKSTGTLAQNVNYAVKIAYALPMLINHGVNYIEPSSQRNKNKTALIESISDSVVLVVAEQ